MQHRITTSCRASYLGEYIHRYNDAAKIIFQGFAIKYGLLKGKLSPSCNCELQSVLVNSQNMLCQVCSNWSNCLLQQLIFSYARQKPSKKGYLKQLTNSTTSTVPSNGSSRTMNI